ncbi:class I SAM-dependent methyltransferase [Pseudomonas putida]|uniref:class I SAM-dependent methyltransferase n=1 Tax=Pseudomonas TaxID=286 RepID=UPI0018D5DE50|nr:class I SAM-dependent methyltransferase [Pseudomonas putida]MBH3471187.1 methyltransferase domain-containing protein [Pseudomonas putida]
MTIDLKKLQKTIQAEVNRREYERVTASADSAKLPSNVPNDIVRTFELLDLEGYLPPKPEAPVQPEVAATPAANDDAPQAQTPPPSLYRRLRGLPVAGKLFSHPRIMNFLTRVRQRPGGATLKNLFITLAHAVAVRVPGVLRMRQVLAVLRHLPERVGALEWHIADGAARLRNVGVQVQNQTNQSLYTHGLAIQQNEQYLIERMRRLEQMLREQTLTIAELQAARPRLGNAVQAMPAVVDEPGMPAELYLEFEASFRGAPEMIRERLKRNLDYFRNDPELIQLPVLDLGCGRGEWLQLLKEEGIPAIGVDSNSAMIENCKQSGLEVYMGDALQYLAAMPANSLAGLTAFHIIEHLPLNVLVRLIDEARRVVCPGGVVLFETPNPENLITGACNFYVDPTHRNPLPPALVAFLLKARGFERVEIDRRHPGDPSLLLQGNDEAITTPLNRLLFGPQDYAAIGYAP